jgi:ABC-2 type transport system permease protein
MNTAVANIVAVIKRELTGYFASPVAFVFLVIYLLLSGFFTFMVGRAPFFQLGQASMTTFFIWQPWLFLFLVPAVGMRLWSEERRLGTIELLLTMPLTSWQAIMGKFLASWLFLGLALLLTFPTVLTVNYLGDPDNGVILCSYFGSVLLAGAYLAVSCMTSAMTRNQVVSFIIAVVVCLFLILAGFPPVTEILAGLTRPWLVQGVAALSVITHFEGFQKGLLDSRDVLFFLSVMGFCLFTTGVILRGHRAG